MADSNTFRADGQSRLSQFVDVLICERDLFDKALERDAFALEILSGPGLSVAVGRVDRLKELHKCGRREQRKWTRRDQERLAWLQGCRDGSCPQGRVELLLRRHSTSHIDRLFQAALGESQSNKIAEAVSPKLSMLLETHKELRAVAYNLSQREPPGDNTSQDWGEVYARQSEALNNVIPFCPAPAKRDSGQAMATIDQQDEPADGMPDCYVTMSQMAGVVNRNKRTIQRLYDKGKLPTPAVESGKGEGKPHEWLWSEVRPILEEEYNRQLPAVFPADKFVRF